jgi:hypothetical protein
MITVHDNVKAQPWAVLDHAEPSRISRLESISINDLLGKWFDKLGSRGLCL